jgi:general secretion pathway protein A
MYEAFFGLQESPFNVTPDPRFIFFSRQHLEAFSCLCYGVDARKGFVVITGEIGAGKTTLCRVLLNELKGRAKTSIILNPNLSDRELLYAIVEDFGIGVTSSFRARQNAVNAGSGTVGIHPPRLKGKKECFDRLNQFLLSEFRQGLNAVLIIDEAQDLKPRSLEQIRLLSNLETDQHKLLQIVLVGQPELRHVLSDGSLEQLRQRIVVSYHLNHLDLKETENYILHRLKVAGWKPAEAPLFDGLAIEAIFRTTDGIPRLINHLCDRLLLLAFTREAKTINASLVEEAKVDLAWPLETAVSGAV